MIALVASALITASSTAYSTCSSGTVMSDGTHVRWGSVAVNGLPLGSRIRLTRPIHGRRIFTVRDRGGMPGAYDVDVFMNDCRAAVRYGRRRVSYRIVRRGR